MPVPTLQTVRLVTCGSVDDGKSTLIGRLLHDSLSLFDDQLRTLTHDSRRYGTQGDALDLALVTDGLLAEREQGITIDVAYRHFATAQRRYILADGPGHEQYTRNMATGASTADLALILVDARKGVLLQTERHARIASMMGIRHIVLVLNKMDLVGWDQAAYDTIVKSISAVATRLAFSTAQVIPVSALKGDNVFHPSGHMSWYAGPTLIDYLDTLVLTTNAARQVLRLPVQWINRLIPDFRGLCGRIAEGSMRPGDSVRILPSGRTSRVANLISRNGLQEAVAGESVTLTLVDELDVSRGDVIVTGAPPECADQFVARLLWLSEHPMVPGRTYLLKLHTKEVTATITTLNFREDLRSSAQLAAKTLELNEIGVVHVSTSLPVVFEPYDTNRTLGGFILIDRHTFETIGAGMITAALPRAERALETPLAVDKSARARLKQQTPCCIWFTGLSGAGKSTLANMLEQQLFAEGRHTYLLDGDNVRQGLCRGLGFTEVDRVENLRRVAEVCKLMVDAGLVVLAAFISPYAAERQQARELFEDGEFIEVFVDTPIAECERRDPKGLYAKARRGELAYFTGIDGAYEPPKTPDLHLQTPELTPKECVQRIIDHLNARR